MFEYEFQEELGYNHLCSTDGWKEFQEYRDAAANEQGKDFKLISVIPYLDEYEHHHARQNSYLAIYILLGNMPIEVCSAAIPDIRLLAACPDVGCRK